MDRIKLAEAMGWTPLDLKLTGYWMPPGVTIDTHVMHIERVAESDLPDPFTDANDDYAVLEWFRGNYLDFPGTHIGKEAKLILTRHLWNYEIGDYARAAISVLEEQK